jgi:hypothetical protein
MPSRMGRVYRKSARGKQRDGLLHAASPVVLSKDGTWCSLLSAGHYPVTQIAPPLVKLRGRSECYIPLARVPYWVSTRTLVLFAVFPRLTQAPRRVRPSFRVFCQRTLSDLWPSQSILSQTFALLQSITNSFSAFLDNTRCKHPIFPRVNAPPFEVWLPTAFLTQRSCLRASPHPSDFPSHWTIRPQGFSPSRRFAPRQASRTYFIPNPLLGLTLRGFDPH